MLPLSNAELATKLRAGADLLALQGANPFRTQAYRRAAATLEGLGEPVRELLSREGFEALVALPGIGQGIAGVIETLLRTGHWGLLERMHGGDAVAVLQHVPGVGPTLAKRFHDTLGVDSLEQLEAVARAGRLAKVEGVGPRREAAILASLESALGRARRGGTPRLEPPLETLLDVDAEYRRRAEAGELHRISPRRHNPQGEAWLPVLHTDRGPWHFTVMFSNTARAHELGRTRDWVVIYFYDAEHDEGQRTVVSERRGPLAGRRVVRGREAECVEHYTGAGQAEPEPEDGASLGT